MRHPELEELLAFRDGSASAETASHVAACSVCGAEVARLERVREALRSLPELPPERDLWPALREGADSVRLYRRLRGFGWAAAGFALIVTLAAGVRGGIEAWQEAALSRQAQTLVTQSQQLERTLRTYQRSTPMTGRTADRVLELEDRIAVIDARLARAGESTPTQDTLELWRERVTLLDALVAMHTQPQQYVGL